ncbi:hypothetical protein HYALB_00003083 [Hymenoscyphus albidus]|uniref:Vacuolar membrane PQ loop repeat protein n=1 Tax=Hymenoscyphus albidus TaxID=595503 RepID=A0A9N9QBQ0_9HELO|nr:hypothetical protein HYALB_00003083 [Hymenoscyphus albidus]
MASLLPAAVGVLSKDLSLQEALSGIFGSVSLATWMFLLVPQLILNYKTGSADGISLAFLLVWMVGDVTNLAGAAWAGLVPTMIALAIYFCIADTVLITQVLYYRAKNARERKESVVSIETEEEPLLRRRSSDSTGLPGSHRRRLSAVSTSSRRSNSLKDILDEGSLEEGSLFRKNFFTILAVVAVGVVGWAIAWQSGVWVPSPIEDVPVVTESSAGAKTLGYISAMCYLGARIPQIMKNYRDKSCEGLALLFFILALIGNATQGASILFHSLEKEYLYTNLPWLIGSLGTMIEDATIFVQFRMYSVKKTTTVTQE